MQDSPALDFLHGIEDIIAIGILFLSGNSLLAFIAALSSVQGARPSYVPVQNCPALESLHGHKNITAIGRDRNGDRISLAGNSLLASIAALVSAQGALPGSVTVQDSPALDFLHGLKNIAVSGSDSNGYSTCLATHCWHPS